MQKVILALIFTLGLTAAQWTQNPAEVANKVNDSNIVNNNPYLLSSGDNLLVQGIVVSADKTNATIYSKTVATKDLQSSKNTSWGLTLPNMSAALAAGGGVTVDYRENAAHFYVAKDNNGVQQVYISSQSLASSGASANNRAITTLKNNATNLKILSGNAHTHNNKVYVTVLQDSQVVLVGSDISGSSPSNVNLTTEVTDGSKIGCAGVAGSNDLYCAWLVGTVLVEARVDPSKGVVGNASRNDTGILSTGATLTAWSNAATQGVILSTATINRFRSVVSNDTTDLKNIGKVVRVLPVNDTIAVFTTPLLTSDLSVQYVNRNATNVPAPVALGNGAQSTDGSNIIQHKNGAAYVLIATADKVSVGEVWGNTQLTASTLQSIAYVCFAVLAALYVF